MYAIRSYYGNPQRLCRPLLPWPAQVPGLGAGRLELVDLAAGNGHAQQVFIDRVLAGFHRYGDTCVPENASYNFV